MFELRCAHAVAASYMLSNNTDGSSQERVAGGAPDGRAPGEGVEPDGRPRRVVHPEVEQEAAHGGDDQERRHRETLQPEGRHAVKACLQSCV